MHLMNLAVLLIYIRSVSLSLSVSLSTAPNSLPISNNYEYYYYSELLPDRLRHSQVVAFFPLLLRARPPQKETLTNNQPTTHETLRRILVNPFRPSDLLREQNVCLLHRDEDRNGRTAVRCTDSNPDHFKCGERGMHRRPHDKAKTLTVAAVKLWLR